MYASQSLSFDAGERVVTSGIWCPVTERASVTVYHPNSGNTSVAHPSAAELVCGLVAQLERIVEEAPMGAGDAAAVNAQAQRFAARAARRVHGAGSAEAAKAEIRDTLGMRDAEEVAS